MAKNNLLDNFRSGCYDICEVIIQHRLKHLLLRPCESEGAEQPLYKKCTAVMGDKL